MSKKKENNIVLEVVEVKGQMMALLPEMVVTKGMPKNAKVTLGALPKESSGGYPWAPWGANDRLPTDVREKLDMVGIAGRVQNDLAKMLFGNGLVYFKREDLQKGNALERAYIPAVEDFLEDNMLETEWLFPQLLDYRYNWNSFSEGILNLHRDTITGLYHKEAEFCRLEKQNESSLKIENIYYSPDFSLGFPPAKNRYKTIPLLPWFDRMNAINKLNGYKFAWHTRIKTPGILYYARQYWLGLIRKKGWLDVSISVPQIVNAMMDNQVILKYQILIPESYFQVRYQEWDSYTDVKRNSIINTLIAELNEALSGTKNAYKSITTVFKQDPNSGEALGKLEIIAIDDKMKKDNWVPGSQASDAQIVQGLGGHPSMVGLAPEGGKMGAGSGSDKREVFNIEIDTNTIEQRKILEPLNFVARFNAKRYKDWDVVFMIDHNRHTTTNNQEDGRVPSKHGIEVE